MHIRRYNNVYSLTMDIFYTEFMQNINLKRAPMWAQGCNSLGISFFHFSLHFVFLNSVSCNQFSEHICAHCVVSTMHVLFHFLFVLVLVFIFFVFISGVCRLQDLIQKKGRSFLCNNVNYNSQPTYSNTKINTLKMSPASPCVILKDENNGHFHDNCELQLVL